LPLKKLHTFVSYFLKRVGPNKQVKKRGRLQKYEDALMKISTLGIHKLDWLMVSKMVSWNAKYETIYR